MSKRKERTEAASFFAQHADIPSPKGMVIIPWKQWNLKSQSHEFHAEQRGEAGDGRRKAVPRLREANGSA